MSADVGVPGQRSAKPSYRVTTRESFPDHVFVVVQLRGSQFKNEQTGKAEHKNEAEYAELTPKLPVFIPYDPYRGARFLIVSREDAAQYRTAGELADAVEAGRVSALVRHQFPNKESVPLWQESPLTIEYRVQSTANGGIEIVRTTWDQGYQCCAFPLLLTTGTFFGCWWLIRRGRQKPPPA